MNTKLEEMIQAQKPAEAEDVEEVNETSEE